MGYCITQRGSHFKMNAENKLPALEALKEIANMTDKMCGGSSSGEKWFAWVDMDYINDKTLEDAITKWNWHTNNDKEGNITDIYFEGEKLGQEDILFETIAPFVEKNSFIEMIGEDDYMWRWCFDGKKCIEKTPTIVW